MSFIRTRNRVKVGFDEPTLTEQHWKEKQDINSLVARALRGDESAFKNGGLELDASNLPDTLHDYLNQGISANLLFDSLPDSVKKKYSSPSSLIAALDNPDEYDNLVQLGILELNKTTVNPPEPEPVPQPVTA